MTVVVGDVIVEIVVVFIGLLAELVLVSTTTTGIVTAAVIIMRVKMPWSVIHLIAFDFMFPLICHI